MVRRTTKNPEWQPLPPPPARRRMRHFYQGSSAWGSDLVGNGSSSMAKAGCLVTSMTAIAFFLDTVGATMNPGVANALMKDIPGSFIGSNMKMHVAAKALNLQAPTAERTYGPWGDPAHRNALVKAIENGECAIVHVSTDGDPKDGGEHFIAAYAIADGQVLCSDPALGRSVTIPLSTMATVVMWRDKPKQYQIVSVAPVRKLNLDALDSRTGDSDDS